MSKRLLINWQLSYYKEVTWSYPLHQIGYEVLLVFKRTIIGKRGHPDWLTVPDSLILILLSKRERKGKQLQTILGLEVIPME